MDKSPKCSPKQQSKLVTETNKDGILKKELSTGKLEKNKFTNNKVKKLRLKCFKRWQLTDKSIERNFQEFYREEDIMDTTRSKSATVEEQEHSEGIVARTIEEQTAKIPSDVFLYGALGSIALSLYFEISGNPEKSRFIGQWVSPFLLLGVYNKLVKIAGSDRVHK